jgi:hypothetical protein
MGLRVLGRVRAVTAGVFGHWLIGYFAHNHGDMRHVVDDAAVQGRNIRWTSLLTMGECWHNNHHAFPGSARLGLHAGEWDPGWWVLRGFEHLDSRGISGFRSTFHRGRSCVRSKANGRSCSWCPAPCGRELNNMDNPYAPPHAPMNEPPLREQRARTAPAVQRLVAGGHRGLAGLAAAAHILGPGRARRIPRCWAPSSWARPSWSRAVTVYLADASWNAVRGRIYFTRADGRDRALLVGSLALMIEGWICAIVIIPMFALLGGLSGLAMGAICA